MHTWVSFSNAVQKDECVRTLMGAPLASVRTAQGLAKLKESQSDLVVLGWGHKPSTAKPRHIAHKLNIPFFQLEDGLISYLGHPEMGDKRFSLILDKQGIYYDATRLSDIECLMQCGDIDAAQRNRIRTVLNFLRENRISKYNHQRHLTDQELDAFGQRFDDRPVVLVVDQTRGDASVTGALADEATFHQMLSAASCENPDACIVIKAHPDTLLGKKTGYFSKQDLVAAEKNGAVVVTDQMPAAQLLTLVNSVYTVSSQIGFEALIHKVPVKCFGMPFYAGYGLTDDILKPVRPRASSDLETLAYRMLFEYCKYTDPETSMQCELEDVLPLLAVQTQTMAGFDSIHAVGFSLWKRCFIPAWLKKRGEVKFHSDIQAAKNSFSDNDALLLWGKKHEHADLPNILRVEDGFLRSSGLGIDLNIPLSLVFDNVGLYFDATAPSELEQLLANLRVSDEQKQRAASLQQLIVQQGINKYNLSSEGNRDYSSSGKKVILVPGQVDSDASIRYGSPNLKTSKALLQQVRADNPEAFIVFRPHPDTLTGERQGVNPQDATGWADQVELDGSILDSIKACDEVHCLTSLAGFEALLRNKPVTCYGMPFYAGWGLTTDYNSTARRKSKLDLNELVYCSLIAYPRYFCIETQRLTTPERVVELLAGTAASPQSRGFVQRQVRKLSLLHTAWRRR